MNLGDRIWADRLARWYDLDVGLVCGIVVDHFPVRNLSLSGCLGWRKACGIFALLFNSLSIRILVAREAREAVGDELAHGVEIVDVLLWHSDEEGDAYRLAPSSAADKGLARRGAGNSLGIVGKDRHDGMVCLGNVERLLGVLDGAMVAVVALLGEARRSRDLPEVDKVAVLDVDERLVIVDPLVDAVMPDLATDQLARLDAKLRGHLLAKLADSAAGWKLDVELLHGLVGSSGTK